MEFAGNEIGETEAKSLSDALKKTSTLIELNLDCNHKMVFIDDPFVFSFSSNEQTTRLEIQEQHH